MRQRQRRGRPRPLVRFRWIAVLRLTPRDPTERPINDREGGTRTKRALGAQPAIKGRARSRSPIRHQDVTERQKPQELRKEAYVDPLGWEAKKKMDPKGENRAHEMSSEATAGKDETAGADRREYSSGDSLSSRDSIGEAGRAGNGR